MKLETNTIRTNMVDDTVNLMNKALLNANHITLNIPQITLDNIKKNISMMHIMNQQ